MCATPRRAATCASSPQQSGTPRTAARILTAHTASDRAETFFMNAIRGSGAAGLRAFRDAATSSSVP
ncbi:MAG: ATP-binding protein [Collinsella sp.]